MSITRPADRSSTLAYGLLAFTFAVMAVFAVERTLRLEARMADEQRQRGEAQLARVLALWEDKQLDRIRTSVGALAADPLAWADRPTVPVEAAYVWQRATEPGGSSEPGRLLHPAPLRAEDIASLLQDPCMVEAARAATPQADRLDIARAWQGCAAGPPPVALLAVSRAADQFLAAGRPDLAVVALQQVELPLFPDDAERDALGLSVDRVVARQLQLAEAWTATGQVDEARDLLVRVAEEILAQDGPALDRTLPWLDFPVVADLRALGAAAAAEGIAARSGPARRRLAGYREALRLAAGPVDGGAPLLQVALPPPKGGAAAAVSVSAIADPFGDRRYLLVLVPLPDGLTVALQLDPDLLLADLLATGPGLPVRVLDAKGGVVMPPDAPQAPVEAQVPFERLFPELRLAMVSEASQAGTQTGWRTSQLAPIALVTLMAGFAMAARIRADRQLRELWERQQAFVNRVSHELKTPLAGVKVMAELVDMGIVSEPEEVRQSAQRIITEVSRMEDRVNEVLRLARRPEITSREELDLQDMAEELVEIWTPRFEQKGARLSAQLEATSPVVGDRLLIRDAMSNLLDNALKYLDDERPGLVRVRTADSGRWVVYEVTDNGIGVPEDMRRAIFERFTRVEREGRGKAGGHGLGLAFVAEAVEGHGGKVECRDGITGGARFVIRLRRS